MGKIQGKVTVHVGSNGKLRKAMNEQNTKSLNPETELYSDLINIIKSLDLFFLGNKLIKAVEQIYLLTPKDKEYMTERCALLCEQLADAQLHYGQEMITKENLLVDIEQTIYFYRESKSTIVNHTVGCTK